MSVEWTESEDELIRTTVEDYREAEKDINTAASHLARVLLHRNKNDIRQRCIELASEMADDDIGTAREDDELEDNDDELENDGDDEEEEDISIKEMMDRMDDCISYLQELRKNLKRFRRMESDFNKLLRAINRINTR